MSPVIATHQDMITEKSDHTFVPMSVSVCFTPGAVGGAPVPIPYPTLPIPGQAASQGTGTATKVATADLSQLRNHLQFLHMQISSSRVTNAGMWLSLLNGYAQTAAALYRSAAIS